MTPPLTLFRPTRLRTPAFVLGACAAIAQTPLGEQAPLGERVATVAFVDATSRSGVEFEHVNGMTGELWLAEVMGAGVAVFDFDSDGLLDLWFVQGGPLRNRTGKLPCDRLYRNISSVEDGLRFADVTADSGVCADGYGMGIATGDYDGDGDADVFLANFGANQILENLGGGQFRDMSATARIGADDWSVSATFADVDHDGRLDLYVGNYVDFTLATHKPCKDDLGRPSYCAPVVYESTSDRLYRNLGEGRFADITTAAGASGPLGAALGVVVDDFDSDGDEDYFVANDMSDNLLWLNDGKGGLSNNGLMAGVAVNADGQVEASMGVVANDFDADCDVDLFMTHLNAQTNTLYVNSGGGWFTDRSSLSGVGASSFAYTGFGTAWFDVDNDGDADLFSANGAVTEVANRPADALAPSLEQRNQFWLNRAGSYQEVAAHGVFAVEDVSRGAAIGDLDNDGDIDIVVTNNDGPARIYRNDSPTGHWLGVGLAETGSRPVIGSRVWLESEPCPRRRVHTDGSYASASDPRILFGLGSTRDAQHVVVRWSDGIEQRFGPLAVDRYHELTRRPDTHSKPSAKP